jgi:hypothetical protein
MIHIRLYREGARYVESANKKIKKGKKNKKEREKRIQKKKKRRHMYNSR